MSTERLEQLKELLAEEPGDVFLRYAIALEMKRRGDMEEAVRMLESILKDEPQYVPCYYQLALMQADLARSEDAAETCRAGALQCLVTGDRKARAELLELLAAISDDEE